MIGLINYGSGNINAIANIYKRLNLDFKFVSEPSEFESCSKLILPGVGDFDETMTLLLESGISDTLNKCVLDKEVPILGVCVGMQIMSDSSEEGTLPGFGWIGGKVRKFEVNALQHDTHLPHMGWNSIQPTNSEGLFNGIDAGRGFYFLHSFYFEPTDDANVAAYTTYGLKFSSSVSKKNIFGVQFHPEKSHSNGVKIFENFAKMSL